MDFNSISGTVAETLGEQEIASGLFVETKRVLAVMENDPCIEPFVVHMGSHTFT